MIRLLCRETYCHPSAELWQEDLSVTVHGWVIKVISRFVADKRYFTRLFVSYGSHHVPWCNDCVYPRLIDLSWQPVDHLRLKIIQPLAVRLRYSNPDI